MFKKILLALVVIIAVFAVVVAMQPSDFRVARSAVIDAPPAAVFDQINDLHKWQQWSPWAKLDPNSKSTFEGPVSGKGAIFEWSGNSDVGEGKMTITESVPNDRVKFRLDFVKPFAGTNDAQFNLEPQGTGTRVTWVMSGEKNFLFKAVGLFMDCDKMLGPQFDKGLARLKSIVEMSPKQAP
jgi:uncharacterized protein YndB with AHSA1/START domain